MKKKEPAYHSLSEDSNVPHDAHFALFINKSVWFQCPPSIFLGSKMQHCNKLPYFIEGPLFGETATIPLCPKSITHHDVSAPLSEIITFVDKSAILIDVKIKKSYSSPIFVPLRVKSLDL